MKKEAAMMIQGALAVAVAFLSAKLGILFPVLCILAGMMALDYITGMMASKVEAIDHPDDPNYGWSSNKGAKGIVKKVAYLCENAGRMGANVPEWLSKYIAVLRDKIDSKAE